MTVETVLRLLHAEGSTVTMTIPGELVEDVDGLPLSVGPSKVQSAILADIALTGDQWEMVARHLFNKYEKGMNE